MHIDEILAKRDGLQSDIRQLIENFKRDTDFKGNLTLEINEVQISYGRKVYDVIITLKY